MRSVFNDWCSPESHAYVKMILMEISALTKRDPNFSEHEYLKDKATYYGYQPVRVAEHQGVWTYSCSDPPGRTFTYDELPLEIRSRVQVLQCVEPFVSIPDVGMRLSGEYSNAHYWLAMPRGYGDQ